MIRHVTPLDRRSSLGKSHVQLLNPIDCAMRCADVALRQLGYPGIETQMLVWLAGKVDAAALRTGIARLSDRYPVVAARLIEPGDGDSNRPYWQFQPDTVCLLREKTLLSDDSDAVLDYAGDVLSNGHDPTAASPLEFHLLHRPGGKDVLLLQYNHVLMDNRVAVPLLLEIDRLATQSDARSVMAIGRRSRLAEHLRQFPREQRHQAVQAAIELQAHGLRGRAATLLPVAEAPPGRAWLRIAARTLGPAETAALRASVVALCGFPCLSMAVLGSAFRAIQYLRPPTEPRRSFVAGIGIPIRRNPREMLTFQNLTSAVPICTELEQLGDRNQVIRLLCEQLRQRLATGIDLGVLGTTAIFSRRFRYVEWAIWHLLRYGYSLWYGYFGTLDAVGRQLCGVGVENIFFTGGPVWPWIGLGLLVNQYGGRLHFQATYDPRLVSPALAEAFLDFVLRDLPGVAEARLRLGSRRYSTA
jgi:hypothetical protein